MSSREERCVVEPHEPDPPTHGAKFKCTVMATFFGEVILPSSRVFFDDSDDDEEATPAGDRNLLEVKELTSGSFGAECDVLIISQGNVAQGFSEYHLIGEGQQPLAEIALAASVRDTESDFTSRSRPTEPSTLYKLTNSIRLLDVSSSIDMLLSNNLTISIEPILRAAKKVLVLCNRPTADFRCDSINDLPNAFLRILKSSSWTEPVVHRTVEQPNFVSGLPASIISWCEASNKPCMVAICFTDTDKAESVTVSPFINFFSSSELAQILTPVHGHILYKKRNKLTLEESNMYL